MYFRKYRLRKTCLDKCLKSRVSQDPSTDNIANGSQHCCNVYATRLQKLLIPVQVITIEKVPFSDIQNPETVLLTH